MKWFVSVGILTLPAVHDRRKAHVALSDDPRRISRSCDALASTGGDVTAKVGQADRYECREPQGTVFRRSAGISHGGPSGF